MGPPTFIGGNLHRAMLNPDIASLQWGRRLSSAEIKQPGAGASVALSASMGPPTFIGGNFARGMEK